VINVNVSVEWNDDIPAIIDKALAAGLNATAVQCQGKMKENFGTGAAANAGTVRKSFRYKKDKDGQWIKKKNGVRKRFRSQKTLYPASAPGDFPAVQTGLLRNSIAVERATPENLLAVVGTGHSYGRWLEDGWANRNRDGSLSHVPARPWCVRTLEEERANLMATMQRTAAEYVTKHLGGGAK
jgi:hypothetical protein